MDEARREVKRWEASDKGWNPLEGGPNRLKKWGNRAFDEASESPTDKRQHEWQKQVKDLWYVMDILKPVRPGCTEDPSEQAYRLADHLDDDYDSAVLRRAVLTSGVRALPTGLDGGDLCR